MKSLLIILFAMLLPAAQSDDPRQAYVDKYAGIAVKEMKRSGVPASITLAQGILESNAGRSALAVKGNNHFGIKCHNDWNGKTMRADDDERRECFRVYPHAEASFRDHSDFLRSKDRYKFLFDLPSGDYKGWARGLKKAGYATDPAYAGKLINLIEEYRLYRYDKGVKVAVEAPAKIETPRIVPKKEVDRKYREAVKISMRRDVYEQNGVPFVYSIEGESYASIARSNGLFTGEILKFNDLTEDRPLDPGTMVYLARKKAQGAEGTGKYVVGADGETLYGISQRFGIRLAALQKMNILLLNTRLEEGDTVILRKQKK